MTSPLIFFPSSLHKTNRFYVAVGLLSNRTQKTWHSQLRLLGHSPPFLPYFGNFCALLRNRRMAAWNLKNLAGLLLKNYSLLGIIDNVLGFNNDNKKTVVLWFKFFFLLSPSISVFWQNWAQFWNLHPDNST